VTAAAALERAVREDGPGVLAAYAPLHAARADLRRRAGDRSAADAAYAAAIAASQNAAQRIDLERRRAAAGRGRPPRASALAAIERIRNLPLRFAAADL